MTTQEREHQFTGRCILWMFVLCVEYSITLGAALDGYKTLATVSGWAGMITLTGCAIALTFKLFRGE